jgi:hypothetical protein
MVLRFYLLERWLMVHDLLDAMPIK